MGSSSRLIITDQNGIRLVRFVDQRLFDDNVVREVGEELLASLPRQASTPYVIDFSQIETISSSMLVKLLLVQRQVDARQGRMRLCELKPTVRGIFRTTNLDRLFSIDRDLKESLEAVTR